MFLSTNVGYVTKCCGCLDDAHPIESGREDKEPILENFPYYSLENKDFLDEIRNCSPMIEVPNAPFLSMKANFNLNVYERNLLGNDEQIDPDLNLLNDNALDAQYADPNTLMPKIVKFKEMFSVLHINARSISSKMDDLRFMLLKLPVMVLALTETWLTEENDKNLKVPGYVTISKPRKDRIRGGVALLIREDIAFYPLTDVTYLAHDTYEGLFINVPQSKGQDLIIGSIYRPPGQPLGSFNDDLAELIPVLTKDRRRVLLMGDFNINLMNLHSHEPTQDFLNILTSSFFAPAINCPTRVTEETATLIDNIFTNFYQEIHDPTVIISDFSDHFPIMLWFNIGVSSAPSNHNKKTRLINENLIQQFTMALKECDWADSRLAIKNGNTAVAYDRFIGNYTEIYNKIFIPVFKKNPRNTPKHPWMSAGLLKSCKTKDKIYIKYKKFPTKANKSKYVKYRNKFKMLKIIAQKTYYQQEFEKYSHDIRKTWHVIKSIINRDQGPNIIDLLKVDERVIRDPNEIAQHFNGFFSGIGNSLAQKIPPSEKNPEDFMMSPICNSFALIHTTPYEIIELAKSSRYSRSEGPDGIDPLVGRRTIEQTADLISEIINSSFETGLIPPDLKKAKITPIFKQGDRTNVTNYRPISVLPYFAKLMEKAVSKRLTDYVENAAILYPMQYGFRQNHSVDMALVNIQDLVTKAIDSNQYAAGVFLDLAKENACCILIRIYC